MELNKVVLFPTCLASLLFPRAAEAARRVLERAGFEVESRGGAVCCGQPAWNSGHVDDARLVAAGAVDSLDGPEPVVLCSGSCTTMVSHYWPQLFAGTDKEEAAHEVASRAREFTSFLVDEVSKDALGALRAEPERTVVYHDSCHMLRGLGLSDEPRELLRSIEGLEVKRLDAQERCCGFGGTFALRYPELSSVMADEKIDDVLDSGAEEVVASDLGCLMQICGRAEERGINLRSLYIAEILDESWIGSDR
jgi:L-lactate dehydrogenase complex protein LldE